MIPAAFICGCGGVSVTLPGAGNQGTGPGARGEPPSRAGSPASIKNSEQAAIARALNEVGSRQRTYNISPGDKLEITVYREQDMDRQVRVTPGGTITFPLIGQIKVGGLQVAEAEQALIEKLKKFLVSPQVSIFIEEYAHKLVYVLGEVKNPGSYPLPPESSLSVLEVLTLAGGFTPYAAVDRTRVIRKKDGKSETFQIEITAITKGGDKSKDIILRPNDVIYVPESFF